MGVDYSSSGLQMEKWIVDMQYDWLYEKEPYDNMDDTLAFKLRFTTSI